MKFLGIDASTPLHGTALQFRESENQHKRLDDLFRSLFSPPGLVVKGPLRHEVKFKVGLEDGKLFGTGTITLADGSKCKGVFINGKGKGTRVLTDGTKWEGEFVDWKLHGRGTKILSDGTEFSGKFINGEFHEGTKKFPDLEIHTGSFVDDKLHGKGTITFQDGTHYEGDVAFEKLHGRGTLTWSDGTKTEGIFENSEIFKGTQTFSIGKIEWEVVNFINDPIQGRGKRIYLDGIIEEGEFVDYKLVKGTTTYPNGDKFEGTYADCNSEGMLICADGQWCKGTFVNGELDGKGERGDALGDRAEGIFDKGELKNGTITWPSGEKITYVDGMPFGYGTDIYVEGKFTGQFENGEFRKGSVTLLDGTKIEGTFVNFLRPSGKCTITCPNGIKFEGQFINGEKNGLGTLTWPNGEKWVGIFDDTSKTFNGTKTLSTKEIIAGVFHECGKFCFFENGKLSGKGTHTFPNGLKYVGTFELGKFQEGSISFPDGVTYTGRFNDDQEFGEEELKSGTITFPNGLKYEGHFFEGKLYGPGKITYPIGMILDGEIFRDGKLLKGTRSITLPRRKVTFTDGRVYIGDCVSPVSSKQNIHGSGTMTCPSGIKLEGDFVNGKLCRGIKIFPDGKILKGDFVQKKINGKGIVIFPDGTKLKGNFVKGRLCKGTKIWPNEVLIEKGTFKKGKLHGKGSQKYFWGTTETTETGDFVDGELHGEGVKTYAEGLVLEGSFVNGRLHGQGTESLNGFVVKGSFERGVLHGQGTKCYPDGMKLEGSFVNGTLHGQGCKTFPNGMKYVGSFENGELTGYGTMSKDKYKISGHFYQGSVQGKFTIHSLSDNTAVTTSIEGEQISFESVSYQHDCFLRDLIPHIILTHAINPDNINHFFEGMSENETDYFMINDKARTLRIIQKLFTPDGKVGSHLVLSKSLPTRPHMHWSWNQLVQPHSVVNDWEGANIAILEPLSIFESTDHKPIGVASYDTFTIGEHQLSPESTILVPEEVYHEAYKYLTGFRGRILSFPSGKKIREVIFETLQNHYPQTWHLCDESGELVGDKATKSRAGYPSATYIKTTDGRVLRLFENGGSEKHELAAPMLEYIERKRHIGLHMHFPTIRLEESDYFNWLVEFTNKKKIPQGARFIAQYKSPEDLKKGALEALEFCQAVERFDLNTRIRDLSHSVISGALLADLASLNKEKYPDQGLDFSSLSLDEPWRTKLINTLTEIQKYLKDGDKEQARSHFDQYRSYLKQMIVAIT